LSGKVYFRFSIEPFFVSVAVATQSQTCIRKKAYKPVPFPRRTNTFEH
jgi:hypothetical protein